MNITLISYILGGGDTYYGGSCIDGMLFVTRHENPEKVSLLMFKQDIAETDKDYEFEYQVIDNNESFDNPEGANEMTKKIWSDYEQMLKDYKQAWVEQRQYEESERLRKAKLAKKAREKRKITKEKRELMRLKALYEPNG